MKRATEPVPVTNLLGPDCPCECGTGRWLFRADGHWEESDCVLLEEVPFRQALRLRFALKDAGIDAPIESVEEVVRRLLARGSGLGALWGRLNEEDPPKDS